MKHAQKMVMITEHLMQTIETEHRLTAPAQLTTLTRLDQDMKQINNNLYCTHTSSKKSYKIERN